MDGVYRGYPTIDDVYENYKLDEPLWSLSDEDKQLLDACVMLVDHRMSIRECSKETLIPKSTLHEKIHTRLNKLSDELYYSVKKRLNWNKRNISSFMRKKCK